MACPALPVVPTTEVMKMSRPQRWRIMPRRQARASTKPALRLTSRTRLPVLVLHAKRETVAGDAAAMGRGWAGAPRGLRRPLGQHGKSVAIGEVARQRMGAFAQPRSERLQRLRPPARERHCRALGMKSLGNGAADAARGRP